MSESERTESGQGASIQLPWEWAKRPRPVFPLLPTADPRNGMKSIAVTCIRCGRTTWRDEIALCACRAVE